MLYLCMYMCTLCEHVVAMRCFSVFWFTVHTWLNLGRVNNNRVQYGYRVFDNVTIESIFSV